MQNEIAAIRESEASERASWERDCRQRLDEEWKSKETGLNQFFTYLVSEVGGSLIKLHKWVSRQAVWFLRLTAKQEYLSSSKPNLLQIHLVPEFEDGCRQEEVSFNNIAGYRSSQF